MTDLSFGEYFYSNYFINADLKKLNKYLRKWNYRFCIFKKFNIQDRLIRKSLIYDRT